MMEMQPRCSRQLNVYDISEEQPKTEDIYESLKTPAPVATRKASGKKIMALLLLINIVLLTSIFLVTGLHYHHVRQSGAEVLNNQKSNQDVWYLHAEMFYLFWRNRGHCRAAEMFCAARMANLATVTKSNMDWLQSQINGMHMLVKKSQSHSSGDGSEYVLGYDDDDDDDSDCELFGANNDVGLQVEGWVCEKAAR